MKQSQSKNWTSIFLDITLLVGLVIVWIVFAPTKIGGQASYVMVNGISMEPKYHTGDLIIVRKARTYQVGDVVTYRDPQMNAYVIHRIVVAEPGGTFTIKGDNNTWLDAYHPAASEIIGKQWIYVPKLALAVRWFRTPINMSLTVVLLGGIFMTSLISRPSKKQKNAAKQPAPVFTSGGVLEGSLYLLGFLFVGFLALSIFAFTRPLTRVADDLPYQQESNYFYSATGTPGVYDTEMVRTGEPVFPRLTCFLNVGFTYSLMGGQFQEVLGHHQMYARISDAQSGWQRTIPMVSDTSFSGTSYFTLASLDLCQLEALANTLESQTGLRANVYTVDVITNIAFTARAAGQVVTDTFDPVLTFKFDKVHLYLPEAPQGTDPLQTVKKGLIAGSGVQPNTLTFLEWQPTVGAVRSIGLIGLMLSLGGLALVGWFVFNTTRQGEDAMIGLRYGDMLMEVYEGSLDPALPVIDVASIDDLAHMAERQNTMIMHMTINSGHFYLVQGNGVIYRYAFNDGKNRISVSKPGGRDMFDYLDKQDPYLFQDGQPDPAEADSYLVDLNVDRSKKPPDTSEILGRIKM
jgi:signal peptidase I